MFTDAQLLTLSLSLCLPAMIFTYIHIRKLACPLLFTFTLIDKVALDLKHNHASTHLHIYKHSCDKPTHAFFHALATPYNPTFTYPYPSRSSHSLTKTPAAIKNGSHICSKRDVRHACTHIHSQFHTHYIAYHSLT